MSAESVRTALASFSEVYECLQPYERKELVRLLLHRAEVCENRITLEIRGGLAGPLPTPGELKSASRSGRPEWLPGAVAHSVIIDRFRCSIATIRHQHDLRSLSASVRQRDEWTHILESGEVANRAELARRASVSRARVTQVLGRRSK